MNPAPRNRCPFDFHPAPDRGTTSRRPSRSAGAPTASTSKKVRKAWQLRDRRPTRRSTTWPQTCATPTARPLRFTCFYATTRGARRCTRCTDQLLREASPLGLPDTLPPSREALRRDLAAPWRRRAFAWAHSRARSPQSRHGLNQFQSVDDDTALEDRIVLVRMIVKSAGASRSHRSGGGALAGVEKSDLINRWAVSMELDRVGAHRMRTRIGIQEGHVSAQADMNLCWCDAGRANRNGDVVGGRRRRTAASARNRRGETDGQSGKQQVTG